MKLKAYHLFLLIAVVMSVAFINNGLLYFENMAEDQFYQSPKPIDNRIVIVGIDDTTLSDMGRWPYSRTVQAKVIENIEKGDPAAVGVDIVYAENSANPDDDTAMMNVLSSYDNIVLPVFAQFSEQTEGGQYKIVNLERPIPDFEGMVKVGHINTLPDQRDGIVRKYLDHFKFEEQDVQSFTRVLYNLYAKKNGEKPLENLPLDKYNRLPIDYTGKSGQYEEIPYSAIYNGDVPPSYLKDRIVLVAPYATGLTDYFYTPLDKQQMFGIEVHANILQMFFDHRIKEPVGMGVSVAAIWLMVLVASLVCHKSSMGISAGATLILVGGWCFGSKYLYDHGTILPLVYPAAAALLVFLVSWTYKYIGELLERKRITSIFGRYVSPQVVGEILKVQKDNTSLGLGGMKREVSVLFVDIRGFTPLSEKMQPEQIVEILNEYLNLTATSIFKFGGTVDKFIGDATMALFNAPLDLDDHALMAVKAAWAMKEGADELEKSLLERFGRSVKFGIGVNTGDAVIGNIGATFRMDYTAIGDTVNTSARLEANAKPGQIILSEATYERVKGRVQVNDIGTLKVKGKEVELKVYELTGIGPPPEIDPVETVQETQGENPIG